MWFFAGRIFLIIFCGTNFIDVFCGTNLMFIFCGTNLIGSHPAAASQPAGSQPASQPTNQPAGPESWDKIKGFEVQLRQLEIEKVVINTKICVSRCLLEEEGAWALAKLIRNIIPMLMAVLQPCKTFGMSSRPFFDEQVDFMIFRDFSRIL